MNSNFIRRADGTIDLVETFDAMTMNTRHLPHAEKARGQLEVIESIHPISSRQAAAVALGVAFCMAKGH